MRAAAGEGGTMRLVVTSHAEDCHQISRADVQAVIYTPPALPPWFEQLARAVAAGAFRIDRLITDSVRIDDLAAVTSRMIVDAGLSAGVKQGLLADVSSLANLCREVSGAIRFQLRLMTPTPDLRHGFHLDLTDRAAARRVLRIYGAGSEYLEPDDVTGWVDFLAYVHRREHVAKRLSSLSGAEHERCVAWLQQFDRRPPFLRAGARIKSVPRGAIALIEAVPGDRLRPHEVMHGRARGWVHKSPASGPPRLVVSVTSR